MLLAKEEATREEEERLAAARAEIPDAAFEMPLDQIPDLKEHIFNIITEAGYENIGQVIFDMKTDPNKVLGLAGIGAKAIQNIEESLAALTFPEPVAEPQAEEAPEAVAAEAPLAEVPVAEAPVADTVAESATVEEMIAAEKPAEKKKESKRAVVEEETEDGEVSKDGVSLDELFKIKAEMFQAGAGSEEESDDKKKGKKGKKKSVALEFDESLGEVVSRKKHKRGDEGSSDEDW